MFAKIRVVVVLAALSAACGGPRARAGDVRGVELSSGAQGSGKTTCEAFADAYARCSPAGEGDGGRALLVDAYGDETQETARIGCLARLAELAGKCR